jgi:diguanylate cyclase (GGDEF)-like protein
MISIRRFLEQASEETELNSALLRLAHLLFMGIAMHSVEVNKADYEQFRDDILKLDQELGEKPTSSKALVVAGTTIRAMEEYAQRATRFSKAQTVEFQNMLTMFADTVAVLSAGNKTAVVNLQNIERQLQGASMIEDIRTIRARLSQCLATVQEESLRQKQENARTILQMRQQLEKSKEAMKEATRTRDPLTGLLDRTEANKVIRDALECGSHAFVALFLVRHLELINGRFGYVVGDQVLNLYGTHIRQSLKAGDQLFRWLGPCFLAVLERSGSTAEVRAELDRICSARLEKFVETGSRTALVTVSSIWTVFNLQGIQTIEEVMHRIEEFIHSEDKGRPESPSTSPVTRRTGPSALR